MAQRAPIAVSRTGGPDVGQLNRRNRRAQTTRVRVAASAASATNHCEKAETVIAVFLVGASGARPCVCRRQSRAMGQSDKDAPRARTARSFAGMTDDVTSRPLHWRRPFRPRASARGRGTMRSMVEGVRRGAAWELLRASNRKRRRKSLKTLETDSRMASGGPRGGKRGAVRTGGDNGPTCA